MTEQIAGTGSYSAQASAPSKVRRSPHVAELAAGVPGEGSFIRSSDQVEVSSMATYLSKLSQLPPIRGELVASVRAQIEAGTYETPEKLDFALGELSRELAE